jgi:hypothetical protein
MAQYIFGTGQLYGMPVGGGAPLKFGALQDVSVDISADIKQLYGQNQFPLAVARGKVKIEGKAMTGEVNPDLYNALFFGQTTTTGAKIPIFSEAATVPAAGAGGVSTAIVQAGGIATATFAAPHGFSVDEDITVSGATPAGYNVANQPVLSVPTADTLTYHVPSATATPATVQGTFTGSNKVQVANGGAAFTMDLGVINAVTGVPYEQVASGPITGQYSVDTLGNYTFAVADVGVELLISYIFTDATQGGTINISNELMGVAPTWQMVLTETFDDKTFVLVLYSCTSSKFSLPFKQDDFEITELDFQAQSNDAGLIGYISASLTAVGG